MPVGNCISPGPDYISDGESRRSIVHDFKASVTTMISEQDNNGFDDARSPDTVVVSNFVQQIDEAKSDTHRQQTAACLADTRHVRLTEFYGMLFHHVEESTNFPVGTSGRSRSFSTFRRYLSQCKKSIVSRT